MALQSRLWRWRTADCHEVSRVRALRLDDGGMRDTCGCERMSERREGGLIGHRKGDGVGTGWDRTSDGLVRCVDEVGADETDW